MLDDENIIIIIIIIIIISRAEEDLEQKDNYCSSYHWCSGWCVRNEPQPHLKHWAPRVRDPAVAAMCYSGHPENCAVGDWSWMGEWHGRNGRLTLC